MVGEGALDADAMAHTADGEAGAGPAGSDADDDTFEDLDALTVALDDFGVNAHRIAGPEVRDLGFPLEVYVGFGVHGTTLLV